MRQKEISASASTLEAVIFDLDGTLIDSERRYEQADIDFLERHGVTADAEYLRRFRGMGNIPFLLELKRAHAIPGSVEELLEEKDQLYLSRGAEGVHAFPEMVSLVVKLRERGVPLAVASGSTRHIIEFMLDHFGLRQLFQVVVSADETGTGKPDPAVFVEAARRLGTTPKFCVVVEDTALGVEAASRAGMRSVAVPSLPEESAHQGFQEADLLFERGMEEFSAKHVLQWLGLEE